MIQFQTQHMKSVVTTT